MFQNHIAQHEIYEDEMNERHIMTRKAIGVCDPVEWRWNKI